jgi:hypothetical protein
MRVIASIFFFMLSTSTLFAQDGAARVEREDSIKLLNTWHKFMQAIESKDRKLISKLSLKLIDCVTCTTSDSTPADDFVLIDTFTNQLFRNMIGSPLWNEIKLNRFSLNTIVIKDYHPRSLSDYKQKTFPFYQVIFYFKPKEYAEGFSYFFRFIKLDNNFKFYGLETIP